MTFSWEKIHFNKWPRRLKMPQKWKPFSPQSSLPHTFCRRPCSFLTSGVLPLACLLTREPFPSRLVEDLPPIQIPLIPSISSLVPRNSSQVLAHHHMAMISPPYFMMHVCYPWRNYRQVPSAGFSNISVHLQPTDKLRSDEKGLGVRQSMSITYSVSFHNYLAPSLLSSLKQDSWSQL